MTIADFLYQASLWQWLGLFIVLSLIPEGAAKIIYALRGKKWEE